MWDPVKIKIQSVNSEKEVKTCISIEFPGDPDVLKPGAEGARPELYDSSFWLSIQFSGVLTGLPGLHPLVLIKKLAQREQII